MMRREFVTRLSSPDVYAQGDSGQSPAEQSQSNGAKEVSQNTGPCHCSGNVHAARRQESVGLIAKTKERCQRSQAKKPTNDQHGKLGLPVWSREHGGDIAVADGMAAALDGSRLKGNFFGWHSAFLFGGSNRSCLSPRVQSQDILVSSLLQ